MYIYSYSIYITYCDMYIYIYINVYIQTGWSEMYGRALRRIGITLTSLS